MDGGEMGRGEADAEVPPVAPQDSAEQEPTFQDLLEERLPTLGFAPYSPQEAEALRQMPEFSLLWPAGEQAGLRPLEALRAIEGRWNKPEISLRPNEGGIENGPEGSTTAPGPSVRDNVPSGDAGREGRTSLHADQVRQGGAPAAGPGGGAEEAPERPGPAAAVDLTDRLAEVVARGKAAGLEPQKMFNDFTGRGADTAVALAAIQRHFPDFKVPPGLETDWQSKAARETLEEHGGRTYPLDVLEFFAGRTMAPPPPYTLGGGTVTRPVSPNILTRLRKDRIIQDLAKALRDLGKGGLALQGSLWRGGALGQTHRQSGNVRLRYITDIDAAAHEFGHRLQDAMGVRNQDLQPFLGELAAIQSATHGSGATLPEGWAEFWRLHANDPLGAAQVAPQLYRWAEARLRMDPTLDAAWQAFRSQIMELRAQPPIERVRRAPDRAETADTALAGHTTTLTARLKASAQRWRASMKTTAKVLGAVALLLILLFAGPIVFRAGQRWSFYFSCPYGDESDQEAASKHCWRLAGIAVMHGGKLPNGM
jgi:hypothetical protein